MCLLTLDLEGTSVWLAHSLSLEHCPPDPHTAPSQLQVSKPETPPKGSLAPRQPVQVPAVVHSLFPMPLPKLPIYCSYPLCPSTVDP